MKTIIKRVVACIVFCTILLLLIGKCNDVLISKTYNRYFYMDKLLEKNEESFDVLAFGACHTYTSFHTPYFEEKYDHSAYAMGNPGEIIPVTYLRMLEQFKKDVPKVALVEYWGLNAYEADTPTETIFEYYMAPNIELLPLSIEKLKVINDYDSLDSLLENFPIAKYKDRIMNMELRDMDFNYSFDTFSKYTSNYSREEMQMRTKNNGFCIMPLWHEQPELYTPYRDISDYYELQAKVTDDDTLAFEDDIMKYVEKIIELCDEYDVELIFYRTPYLCTENAMRKLNWFEEYCEQNDVAFFNLEKELDFDLKTDFLDYGHLNDVGAKKATDYLSGHILKAINSK